MKNKGRRFSQSNIIPLSMNEDCFHLGVKALIRNLSGKILLLKVNPAQLKNYSGEAYWDIPGGRVQRGASVEETLRREVEEETGITNIKATKLVATILSNIRIPVQNGDVGLLLSVYSCQLSEEPSTIRLSGEHTEAGWFFPKEASELLKVKYPEEFTDMVAIL